MSKEIKNPLNNRGIDMGHYDPNTGVFARTEVQVLKPGMSLEQVAAATGMSINSLQSPHTEVTDFLGKQFNFSEPGAQNSHVLRVNQRSLGPKTQVPGFSVPENTRYGTGHVTTAMVRPHNRILTQLRGDSNLPGFEIGFVFRPIHPTEAYSTPPDGISVLQKFSRRVGYQLDELLNSRGQGSVDSFGMYIWDINQDPVVLSKEARTPLQIALTKRNVWMDGLPGLDPTKRKEWLEIAQEFAHNNKFNLDIGAFGVNGIQVDGRFIDGDEAARLLALSLRPFAIKLANDRHRMMPEYPLEEFVSVANLAFWRSSKTYNMWANPFQPTAFISYAGNLAELHTKRHAFENMLGSVRLPEYVIPDVIAVKNYMRDHKAKYGTNPSSQAIIEAVPTVTTDNLARIMTAVQTGAISGQHVQVSQDGEEGRTVFETIADPENEINNTMRRQDAQRALELVMRQFNLLSETRQDVIRRRHFTDESLLTGKPIAFKDLGRISPSGKVISKAANHEAHDFAVKEMLKNPELAEALRDLGIIK